MYCGHCGAPNPDVNRFCAECGTRLVRAEVGAGPLVDEVAARLHGLDALPQPTIEWPKDLPRAVLGSDGMRLLLVPGGFFRMGSRKEKKDERPQRLVWVDSFYVDAHPITVKMYGEYLDKTGVKAPSGFSRAGGDEALRPVTRVTWDEAAAYAKWAQRRLPTEAQWEKAARGVDGRIWPWGDDAPEDAQPPRAAFGDEDGEPPQVQRYAAGRSPYGAWDLSGTVWEWCHDQYDQHYYPRADTRNPVCEDGDPLYRVLRGGAVTTSSFVMRAAFRGWNLPHQRSRTYGFRCVVEAARYRGRAGLPPEESEDT